MAGEILCGWSWFALVVLIIVLTLGWVAAERRCQAALARAAAANEAVARAARLAAANERLFGGRAAADQRAAAVAVVAAAAAPPSSEHPHPTPPAVDVAVDLSFAVTCKICWDQPLEVLLMPCKHVALCQQCAADARVARCPVCNVDIQHRLRVHV